mgnify:FL=1
MQLTLENSHQPGSNASCLQEAVSFINIDQPADESIQNELKELENVIAVYQINLN